GEPVRALDRPRLVGHKQLGLDTVEAGRVRSHQLRFHICGDASCPHVPDRNPRIGAVKMVTVARPKADVLESTPLTEYRYLIRFKGNGALLGEGLRREAGRGKVALLSI